MIRTDDTGADLTAERVGRNQSLFREINERLTELNRRLERLEHLGTFLCECGDSTCAEQIVLSREEYAELRLHPLRFAVAAGHVFSAFERVVYANDRYTVVEKEGRAAKVADELFRGRGRG